MGLFKSLKGFLDRGATVNSDFIPYNHRGWIIQWDGFGSSDDFSNIATPMGQATVYRLVRDIRMVINRLSGIFRNGKLWILDDAGNEPHTPEAEDARALLSNPNPLQTWADFYVQQKAYKYIFGYCPVYKLRAVGTGQIVALYNILPPIFDVDYTGNLYRQTDIGGIVKSYRIRYNGIESTLNLSDVYIAKDNSASVCTDSLLPESRLVALQYDAALVRALGNARFSMVEKRGAIGILSNESKDLVGHLALTPEEKDDIQREYERYGITAGKNKLIITDANLKWQQMAFSTRDLMLLELGEDAKMQIADMYDYPAELLSSSKGVTFSNRREAMKALYQDTAIPEAMSDAEELTRELGLEGCRVSIDFSEVPALQEDRKLRAETLRFTTMALDSALSKNVITREEYRRELSQIIEIDPKQVPDEEDNQEGSASDPQQETEGNQGEENS